jgi:hypothetical protein
MIIGNSSAPSGINESDPGKPEGGSAKVKVMWCTPSQIQMPPRSASVKTPLAEPAVAHAISTTKAIGIYEVNAARTASVAPAISGRKI